MYISFNSKIDNSKYITIRITFVEGGHDVFVGRYLLHVLRLGANQTDQRYYAVERIEDRPEIRE